MFKLDHARKREREREGGGGIFIHLFFISNKFLF